MAGAWQTKLQLDQQAPAALQAEVLRWVSAAAGWQWTCCAVLTRAVPAAGSLEEHGIRWVLDHCSAYRKMVPSELHTPQGT